MKVDRRKGAVIAIDVDRMRTMEELKKELQVILAKSSCKNIPKEEVHALIDEIYEHIFQVDLSDYKGLVVNLLTDAMQKTEGSGSMIVHVAREDFAKVSGAKE